MVGQAITKIHICGKPDKHTSCKIFSQDILFSAYLPYFEKIKGGLCDLHALRASVSVCLCVCVSALN
jgi:hypothetical protein